MTWGAPSWRDGYLDRKYAVKSLLACRRQYHPARRLTAAESEQLAAHVYRVLALDWYRWQVAR